MPEKRLFTFQQIEVDDMPQCRKTVFPCDLLPFEVVSGIIRDRYFHHPAAETGKLCGYLGFESKSVTFDHYIFDNVLPEKFVTGFHIGEIQP